LLPYNCQVTYSNCHFQFHKIKPIINMKQIVLLAALIGVAISTPTPQMINLDAIDAAPDPVLVSAPIDVTQNVPAPVPSDPLTPITDPNTKRGINNIEKRDGTCAPQPSGSGKVTSPDTAEAFCGNSEYSVHLPVNPIILELKDIHTSV